MTKKTETLRGRLLTEAKQLTENDRNKTYGDPVLNMLAYADLIEGYLRARGIIQDLETSITAEDAARFLQMAKWARTCDMSLPYHEDNYRDDCAYGAIAAECSKGARK